MRRVGLGRARRASGYTQEQLADEVGVDRTTVARWESGDCEPHPHSRSKLARALKISPYQLDELLAVNLPVPRSEPDPVDMSGVLTIPMRSDDGRIFYVPFDRRRFMRGVGAGFVTSAAGGVGATSPSTPMAAYPIEHFQQVRKALADSDNLFGPNMVIPTAREQINTMQELRQSRRGGELRRLLRVQAEFADLLGWLHQDKGEHHAAQFWLDRALEWSYSSGDQESAVFILARKSQLAGDMKDGAETVGLAEAALSMAGPRSRIAAIATTYAAHGYALQSEAANSNRAYERARELLADADSDETPWGQFFDDAYIGVQQAQSWTVLGEYRAAAEQYRSAIAALPTGFRRDQGVYLAREALAYANAHDAEKAADIGLNALTIGVDTGSRRVLDELVQVGNELGPWKAKPEVSHFYHALKDALQKTHQSPSPDGPPFLA